MCYFFGIKKSVFLSEMGLFDFVVWIVDLIILAEVGLLQDLVNGFAAQTAEWKFFFPNEFRLTVFSAVSAFMIYTCCGIQNKRIAANNL